MLVASHELDALKSDNVYASMPRQVSEKKGKLPLHVGIRQRLRTGHLCTSIKIDGE